MPALNSLDPIVARIKDGSLVPYLGPDALRGVVDSLTKSPIPADSDSLILAMNDGKPMAPRLMYEFARAAMNVEQKKGRKSVERFLTTTYAEKKWSTSVLHQWLAALAPHYVVDINRDTQMQTLYAGRAHTLVVGVARIAGTQYRFKLYQFNPATGYAPLQLEEVDKQLPILFKPMGTPLPEANYIASDADYVDYITELMGGFAIPNFLKEYRLGKKYLFIGMRFLRDTERMVLSDIIHGADSPAGFVLLPEPTDKERRFCEKKQLQIIEADWQSLIAVSGVQQQEAVVA